MYELFTSSVHRFKQLFKKPVVGIVRNSYAFGDIVTCIRENFLKFSCEKHASLSRDISRHKAPINFLSSASERADDFVPAACQRFARFATTMPLKRFLKGEKPF